jgi:hypothetical protein
MSGRHVRSRKVHRSGPPLSDEGPVSASPFWRNLDAFELAELVSHLTKQGWIIEAADALDELRHLAARPRVWSDPAKFGPEQEDQRTAGR